MRDIMKTLKTYCTLSLKHFLLLSSAYLVLFTAGRTEPRGFTISGDSYNNDGIRVVDSFDSKAEFALKGTLEDFIEALGKAKQGDAQAQHRLGDIYSIGLYQLNSGWVITEDNNEAFYWYEKAAHNGFAEAQESLGSMYKEGITVPKDYEQAIYWYEKAIHNGCIRANAYLGHMYYEGKGVPQNYKQAIFLYEKGAYQGDYICQLKLALSYQQGWGVPQNFKQAYIWYNLAGASDLRDEVAKSLTLQQLNDAQDKTIQLQRKIENSKKPSLKKLSSLVEIKTYARILIIILLIVAIVLIIDTRYIKAVKNQQNSNAYDISKTTPQKQIEINSVDTSKTVQAKGVQKKFAEDYNVGTIKQYGGIRRLAYYGVMFVITLLLVSFNKIFFNGTSSGSPIFDFVMIIAWIIAYVLMVVAAFYRLKNIGVKGWWALFWLIPLIGAVPVGIACATLPEGYKDTRKMDTFGCVLLAIMIIIPILGIIASIVIPNYFISK